MTRLIPRYVVIPTRNRFNVFYQAYEAIKSQVDQVIVINNGSDDLGKLMPGSGIIEIWEDEQPVNLSRLWNLGLDEVEEQVQEDLFREKVASPKWDVAIINDDCIVPEGWFDAVSGTMRSLGAAAGSSGGHGALVLHTEPGPVNLATRMQGFAFLLAGEKGARAEERLRWYAGDDSLEWTSRLLGGVVQVPGYQVNHLFPNGQVTPELQEQIARDMQTFVDIWGRRPW